MLDITKTATLNISQYTGGSSQEHKAQIEVGTISANKKSTDQNDIASFEINQTGYEKVDEKEKLTEDLNKISESMEVDIKFAYNDKIDELYINVIDKKSGKVIRTLPSEEAMKIKETMKEFVGSLFDTKG